MTDAPEPKKPLSLVTTPPDPELVDAEVDEPEDDAAAAEEAEYVEELGDELTALYTQATGIARDNLKVGTGTVVSQLLQLRLIDSIEALGEKLDEVHDLLAAQDERAADVAAALSLEPPKSE